MHAAQPIWPRHHGCVMCRWGCEARVARHLCTPRCIVHTSVRFLPHKDNAQGCRSLVHMSRRTAKRRAPGTPFHALSARLLCPGTCFSSSEPHDGQSSCPQLARHVVGIIARHYPDLGHFPPLVPIRRLQANVLNKTLIIEGARFRAFYAYN
eukprot:6185064-Pleurochrysis_carterae.AAC.2